MRDGYRVVLLILLSRAGCVCEGYPGSPLHEAEAGGPVDASRPEARRDASPTGWAISAGGIGEDTVRAVAVDGAGNLVLAGHYAGTMQLGGHTLTSTHASGLFVAKLDRDGKVLWPPVTIQGELSPQDRDGLAVDAAGNIYYATSFNRTVEVRGRRMSSEGNGILVLKLGADGSLGWPSVAGVKVSTPTPGSTSHPCCLALDTAGELVVAGRLSGSLDLGNRLLTAAGRSDIFLARLDPNGAFTSAVVAGSDSEVEEAATGLVLDGRGNAYLTGQFSKTVTFGEDTFSARDTQEVFVAKLDPSLQFLWACSPPWQTPVQRARTIDRDEDALYVGGSLRVGSAEALVVMKLGERCEDIWNRPVWGTGGAGESSVTALLAGRGGRLPVVAGTFTGTGNFKLAGSGAAGDLRLPPSMLSASGDQDIFVARLGPTGNFSSVEQVGGADSEWLAGLASDGGETLYVAGAFQGSMTVAGARLVSKGGRDLFLWKTAR